MTKRTEDMTAAELQEAFFGAEAVAAGERTEEILRRAREEDGIDYADYSLGCGEDEFRRHRNAVRAKRGLPPI